MCKELIPSTIDAEDLHEGIRGNKLHVITKVPVWLMMMLKMQQFYESQLYMACASIRAQRRLERIDYLEEYYLDKLACNNSPSVEIFSKHTASQKMSK